MVTRNGQYKGGKIKDMTGLVFGRLTVIEPVGIDDHHEMRWRCVCECGKEKIVRGSLLRNGGAKSCGCLHKDAFQKYRKQNDFRIEDGVVHVVLNDDGIEMLCDADDWNRLKGYKWRVDRNGYAVTSINREVKHFHHLVIGCEKGMYRDHINRNRLDNRKENLRVVGAFESVLNRGLSKNNTSGHKGVTYSKRYKKWVAQITHNRKNNILGRFDKIEDAIKAREEAEIKFFGMKVGG